MENHLFRDWLAEVDGPSAEWYREAAESAGALWPRPHIVTRTTHLIGIARAMALGPRWPCPKCGGPRVCPDLASTLAYRKCGYAEVAGVGWVHQ